VEELHPGRGRAGAQGLHVVLDLEQIAAGGTAVDDLPEAVLPVAAIDALEPGIVAHPRPSIAGVAEAARPIGQGRSAAPQPASLSPAAPSRPLPLLAVSWGRWRRG